MYLAQHSVLLIMPMDCLKKHVKKLKMFNRGWVSGFGKIVLSSCFILNEKDVYNIFALQVELGREMVVTGVITQGRYAGGRGEEFAELVTVQVRDLQQHEDTWRTVAEEVAANTDTYSKVEVLLEKVQTTGVRIIPVSKHPRMVCLRIELLGCDIHGESLQQN